VELGFVVEAARLVDRPNRFLVLVELDGGPVVRAHCADPGRLRALLLPGVRLYVSAARGQTRTRRTAYDLRFVEHPQTGELISLDTRLPNLLVAEALRLGDLEPLRGHLGWRQETPGPIAGGMSVHSRFDFCMALADDRRCWVEVKSVSLVEDGIARFPDAPTLRGQRHVHELRRIVNETPDAAAVVFVVQRGDADVMEPHWRMDPAFGHALALAEQAGVQLYAYTCRLTLTSAQLARPIPVRVAIPEG
jgi:sugar fermentation stimulation protein A